MAHRCTPSSCEPLSRLASVRSALADRTRVAMRFASLRSRLDLGSIFGAKHQSSRTPPVERHGTPRTDTTRTGRQQQGRAPNQDKRRLGARQQRQPSRGRRTRGPRSIGLLMNNELCAGGGVGRCCCWLAVDEHGVQADVAWDRDVVQLYPWILCCIQ